MECWIVSPLYALQFGQVMVGRCESKNPYGWVQFFQDTANIQEQQ